jgi:hypothetical protein
VAWVAGLWVAVSGCVKNERDYQLEHAKTLTPTQLGEARSVSGVAPSLPPQPPRVFTIRAWVDLDYQAQVLLAAASGKQRECVEHLEQVVAGDETVADAWQRLATAYGANGC